MEKYYNFQYLNTSSNKNVDFEPRERRMLKKIEDNKIIFLNPEEFEVYDDDTLFF